MAFARASRARLQATLAWVGSGFLFYHRPSLITESVVIVATTLALLAWFLPKAYGPVQRALDGVSRVLLTGLTWFLLGVVYFGLFTPLRLWRVITRNDPLRLRADSSARTYLQPLSSAAPDRFDRQY
jgi:hypothetical protein